VNRDPAELEWRLGFVLRAQRRYGRWNATDADIDRIAAFAAIHERQDESSDIVLSAVDEIKRVTAAPVGYGEAWA
jgi:hypothetical protein